jgi:hypothetical protein
MKAAALVVFAVIVSAGSAMAGDGPGRGPGGNGGPGQGGSGHGGQGWGWSSGLNVFVDVPMTGAAAGQQDDPQHDRCRDVRHSCFGQWGVDEPGYGRCMRSGGC